MCLLGVTLRTNRREAFVGSTEGVKVFVKRSKVGVVSCGPRPNCPTSVRSPYSTGPCVPASLPTHHTFPDPVDPRVRERPDCLTLSSLPDLPCGPSGDTRVGRPDGDATDSEP